MKKQPTIATILINWNGFKDSKECIQSLLKVRYPHNKIIIVDNASTDDSLSLLKKEFGKKVHFIENKSNLGFTGANNKGFEYAFKHKFDYIFVLNNDTIVDKNIFTAFLSQFGNCSSNLGILSPKIYNYYKPEQIESKGGIIDIIKSRNYPLSYGRKESEYAKRTDIPYEITFASGSAMFIKSEVLKKIGFFDKDYFAYYEDQDFCFKANKAGFKIMYCPLARVWHKVSASTGGYKNPTALALSTRNRIKFALKNGSIAQKTMFLLYFIGYYTPVYSIWTLLNGDFTRLNAFLGVVLSYPFKDFDFSRIQPYNKGFLRIGINARYAQRQITGIERYTVELIRNLARIDAKNRVMLFFNKHERIPKLTNNPFFQNYISSFPTTRTSMRILWDQIFLYFEIKKNRLDIFHGPSFVVPILKPKRCKYVTTIHDLSWFYYPESFTFLNRLFFTLFLPRSINNSDMIIADSYSTKKDIIKFFKVSSEKIKVIYLGIDERFKKSSASEVRNILDKYTLPPDFILSIGSLLPRKNVVNILKAFHALKKKGHKEKLVIIGKKAWLYEQIFSVIKEYHLEDDVIFTGYVDDRDLPALYSASELLLFPSLYEGFGLPILEAMACGCPVITSNISSMPEVAGGAAVLVNPKHIDSITQAVDHILLNTGLKDSLIKKGYEQAKKFNWIDTAEKTLQVYEDGR